MMLGGGRHTFGAPCGLRNRIQHLIEYQLKDEEMNRETARHAVDSRLYGQNSPGCLPHGDFVDGSAARRKP